MYEQHVGFEQLIDMLSGTYDSTMSTRNVNMSYKVVIVGGGISGLAAAHRLIQHDTKDILILEAKDRLGGRIQTVQYGKRHIELGAEWIHGEGDNPVLKLAHTCRNVYSGYAKIKEKVAKVTNVNCCIGESNSDTESSDQDDGVELGKRTSSKFFTQCGRQIPKETTGKVCYVFNRILEEAESFAQDNIPIPAKYINRDSVGEFVREEFSKYVHIHDGNVDEQALLEWKMTFENSVNGCRSLDELSLYALGQYCEFEGRQCVTLNRGYQPILDLLLADIPSENVRANSQVAKIVWSDFQQENRQNCEDEEVDKEHNDIYVTLTSGETLTAEYLIFTGSLGVLKSNASQIFTPGLGTDKTEAIANMGFGVVDKIFLKFERPFWRDDCSGIQFAWLPNQEPFILRCVDEEHIRKYGEWYKGITGFAMVTFHTSLLMAWISGNEAVAMETVDEATVADVCHELLERFSNMSLPKPVKITRSRWGSDPDVLGSYSFMKCGRTTDDCKVLTKPLPSEMDPRLQLAGEACHPQYFSTTAGALLSGQVAADRVIKAINTEHGTDHGT